MKLNSIQEIIEDISLGKMVILMDDEDRENEGDLVLAAEKVNADAINFMATHARGLICLAINEDRCKRLGAKAGSANPPPPRTCEPPSRSWANGCFISAATPITTAPSPSPTRWCRR